MQGNYNLSELQAFVRSLYSQRQGDGSIVTPSLYVAPYAYPITVATLAPAGVSTTQIPITANGDFLALWITHHATIAAAAQNASTKTVPCVRVLITDNGTAEQWTNAAVDLENYSTNVYDSKVLPFPRLVQGKSSLTVQLTSFAAAETYAPLEFAIHGLLIKVLNSTGMM